MKFIGLAIMLAGLLAGVIVSHREHRREMRKQPVVTSGRTHGKDKTCKNPAKAVGRDRRTGVGGDKTQ